MNNDLSIRNRRNFPPIYDPGQQYPEEQSLYSMGQYLQTPSPVKPEAISQYDPAASKKIFGMPVDRFASLLGTLSAAIAPKSAQGRFGAGMVNMAGMSREERLGKGKAQAEMAETRRKEAATAREKAQAKKEKIPSPWEAFYTEKKGQVNPKTNRPWTEAGIYTAFKKVGAKKPAVPKGQAGFEQIEGVWHKGTWRENKFTPWRKATAAEIEKTERKPPAGEESKEMTWPEKRARAKEKRDLESSILNPANLEDPRLQVNIEAFNELPGPYVYHRTLGTPAKETGYFDLERDVPAVPSTIEKIDVSTPEKIRDSDLPVEMKLRLLKTRFGYE